MSIRQLPRQQPITKRELSDPAPKGTGKPLDPQQKIASALPRLRTPPPEKKEGRQSWVQEKSVPLQSRKVGKLEPTAFTQDLDKRLAEGLRKKTSSKTPSTPPSPPIRIQEAEETPKAPILSAKLQPGKIPPPPPFDPVGIKNFKPSHYQPSPVERSEKIISSKDAIKKQRALVPEGHLDELKQATEKRMVKSPVNDVNNNIVPNEEITRL